MGRLVEYEIFIWRGTFTPPLRSHSRSFEVEGVIRRPGSTFVMFPRRVVYGRFCAKRRRKKKANRRRSLLISVPKTIQYSRGSMTESIVFGITTKRTCKPGMAIKSSFLLQKREWCARINVTIACNNKAPLQ